MLERMWGKNILVIGGTGCLGSHIVRQLLMTEPAAVRVFSRDEGRMRELLLDLGDRRDVQYLLGDVRDSERIRRAMYDVDIVIHAAGMRDPALCDRNPSEAVKTNVLGVQNVIEAALEENVELVVAICRGAASCDDTVGATRTLAERLVAEANYHRGSHRTILSCVRLGTVVGDRGSALWTFERQISAGGPVLVKDPRTTRFLMPAAEAAGLVIRAVLLSRGGEVFVVKMPVVRLTDLAAVAIESLANRYGFLPADVGVRYRGNGRVEKSGEVLMDDDEASRAVEIDDMFIVRPSMPAGFHAYPGARPAPQRSYSSRQITPLSRADLRRMISTTWREGPAAGTMAVGLGAPPLASTAPGRPGG